MHLGGGVFERGGIKKVVSLPYIGLWLEHLGVYRRPATELLSTDG
jgi:hypothetical protein